MSREIFISHAVKDKKLADAVVDLLQLGLNISSDHIFCSSLEGLGIPTGVNFVDHIKSQIQSPKAVIVLITPNYLASQFCLCELGATWAMSHPMFPLLAPPLKFSDVQGVMIGVQLTAIDSAERLSELRDHLLAVLAIKGASSARWEVKRDNFLNGLSELLKKLPVPDTVSSASYSKVKTDLKAAKDAISELEEERARLEALVKQLSVAKDKKEVVAIKMAHQPAAETLDNLETQLSETIRELPKCVSFVVYRELALGQGVKIDVFKDPDFGAQINDASDDQLVEIDDTGYCSLNKSHPKVKSVVAAYRELEDFLESAPSELFESFESEYETPLSLGNRKYWERALDKRIAKVYA